MELNRNDTRSTNFIKSHASGNFLINGVLYTQSVIVTTENVINDWVPQTITDLTIGDFRKLAELDPEILILGTGEKLIFPDFDLFRPLIDQKCGYEVMSSRAACNTFNILLGDERKVVAALLNGSL